MPKTTKNDLDRNESDGEILRNSYLRERGWEWTCDNPGSLWLWRKEIKGRLYVCDAGTALAIEFDAEPDEHDESEG